MNHSKQPWRGREKISLYRNWREFISGGLNFTVFFLSLSKLHAFWHCLRLKKKKKV